MVRAHAFQKCVELSSVIHVSEVAELMEHHKVPEIFRNTHKVEIQIDVPQTGAAPPVRGIVLNADLIVGEAILVGQLGETLRKHRLGLSPQLFNLLHPLRAHRLLAPSSAPDDENHITNIAKGLEFRKHCYTFVKSVI